MENLNLPFEYLSFRIGYTLSELEPAFFYKATDSFELMHNENFEWEPYVDKINFKFDYIARLLEVYRIRTKNDKRQQETKESIDACIKSKLNVSRFFKGDREGLGEKLENASEKPDHTGIEESQPLSPDSGAAVQQFTPIFSHHEAAKNYDTIREIIDDTGDFQPLERLYSSLTQQYLEDFKHSVHRALRLNDGEVDPFFELGKTLGGIAWVPNFSSGYERIVYFSEKIRHTLSTAVYKCTKIRPSIKSLPIIFTQNETQVTGTDIYELCKKLSDELKNSPSPHPRHKYTDKPTTYEDYKNLANQGIEIYGQSLLKLRTNHQLMLLMLMLANHPVSAENFSILNEKWREGDGDPSDNAGNNVSAEISKLLNELSKILKISNKDELIIRSMGPDNLARYTLNWKPIDSRFSPTFTYLSNFLS